MELAAELEASLRDLSGASFVEVRENGGRATAFRGLSWEVRGAGAKPLLHLWSEQYNLTRRVLAITDHSEERLALAVERFGRAKPDRLEFIRVDHDRSAREVSRAEFCEHFGRLLAEQFPDETLESLTIAPDLEHSLSGNYARGVLRRGSCSWAVLGVPGNEASEIADNSLTFGLLWLDRAQHLGRRGNISGLRLILPKGAARTVARRVRALRPDVRVDLYEHDPIRETVERIDARATGNVSSWLVARREAQQLLDQARPDLDSIVQLAPDAITVHPMVDLKEVWLRFRGLPFARWEDRRIFFGISEPREELNAAVTPKLRRLVRDVEKRRHPLATDTVGTLYRSQAERWLESVVCEDVTRIDASLDPHFVYTQVFARAEAEHGILDVLTVTRAGRLAILELKASEHIHLPLQAADYWVRIRHHLEHDDFLRSGYFAGLELQNAPPLVYLVAPALRFHPSTDTLLRYLSPEMEMVRVGIAESWRRGFRIVMRQ